MRSVPGAAMPHHEIQLRKGGRLFCIEWIDGKPKEHEIPGGDLALFLNATLCLSDEVSLRDLMLLIERDDTLFATVSNCGCFSELLAEMRSEEETQDGALDMGVLELGWSGIVCDGVLRQESQLSGRIRSGEPAGVEFASTAWLADIPFVLDETLAVVEEEDPEAPLFAARRLFTLEEVVRGVLDGLTVFGGPSGRREMLEQIRDRLDGQQADEDSPEVEAVRAEEEQRRFSCRLCGEDTRCMCFGKPADICHDCFLKMKES